MQSFDTRSELERQRSLVLELTTREAALRNDLAAAKASLDREAANARRVTAESESTVRSLRDRLVGTYFYSACATEAARILAAQIYSRRYSPSCL